jgi:hypothetical protein
MVLRAEPAAAFVRPALIVKYVDINLKGTLFTIQKALRADSDLSTRA